VEFNSVVSTLFPRSRVRSRKDSQSTVSRIIGCPVRIVHVGTPSARHLQSCRSKQTLKQSMTRLNDGSFESGCVILRRSRQARIFPAIILHKSRLKSISPFPQGHWRRVARKRAERVGSSYAHAISHRRRRHQPTSAPV